MHWGDGAITLGAERHLRDGTKIPLAERTSSPRWTAPDRPARLVVEAEVAPPSLLNENRGLFY